MPTVGGRSFDFADISPHGIAAVEVYKTGNAAIPTGGIGATINMVTTKPLDAPGFVGVGEASALDAYSVNGDDYTPQLWVFSLIHLLMTLLVYLYQLLIKLDITEKSKLKLITGDQMLIQQIQM